MFEDYFASYNKMTPVTSSKFEVPEIPKIKNYEDEWSIQFPTEEQSTKSTETSNILDSWINPKTRVGKIDSEGKVTTPVVDSNGNVDLVKIDIEDLFKQEGITTVNGKKINFGSKDLRPANANYGAKNSHHKERDPLTGYANARDISIENGNIDDYIAFRKAILENQKINDYLTQKKWGIINEITPEILTITKGTGNHFHFGPDQWAVRTYNAWRNDPTIDIRKRIVAGKHGTKLESDNTKVIINNPIITNDSYLQDIASKYAKQKPSKNQGTLVDADKVDKAKRQQAIVNENALFGNGVQGFQTNINPYTESGQQAIQANFDYGKDKAKIASETLLSEAALGGTVEGARALYHYLTDPRIIGRGAESIVVSSRISPYVKGITTKSAEEIAELNKYPWMLPRQVIGYTRNGLTKYKSPKIKVYTESDPKLMEEMNSIIQRESPDLERFIIDGMDSGELAYITKDGNVINDIWAQNMGKFGKGPVVYDASILPKDDFLTIFEAKKGGKLLNLIKKFGQNKKGQH